MEGLHESFHETFDLKIWAGTDEQMETGTMVG